MAKNNLYNVTTKYLLQNELFHNKPYLRPVLTVSIVSAHKVYCMQYMQ